MASKSKKEPIQKVVCLTDKEERQKALQTALSQVEKDFGTGSIMKLGENKHMEVQSVHTGSLGLDLALGIGGLPKGRIVEICGTNKEFARLMEKSERTISLKLNNRRPWNQNDVTKASHILKIPEDEIQPYFFTLEVHY